MATTCEHDAIQALANPQAYSHKPESVDVKETHISWVFLAGDYAYKIKKPVRFDFLDFSTVERREQACRDELRLNRRLAPNIYLDVLPVTRSVDGQFRFGGEGLPIDWAVRMRRLPEDKMLESLLHSGKLRAAQVDQLAECLAGFYDRATPAAIGPEEYRSRCLQHVHENRRELLAVSHQLPASLVKRIHATQLQCLALRSDLFDNRVAEGRIVEGHGDLRPEHICFIEPPVVFDCIEFNEKLRTLDVADDLAFLVEECDHLGAIWVGDRLIKRFKQLTGDRPHPMIWAFYKSYRASVRAKVAALRADQVAGTPRQDMIASARSYLELAEGYLRCWERPLFIVIGGLSGTGKTTLATALAHTLGADLLRTDVVRQQLYGAIEHSSPVDKGVYQPSARQRVYDELLAQASALHRERIPVIMDGTFARATLLQAANSIVKQPGGRFLAIECVCRSDVAMERIRRRLSARTDASEARPEIYDQQRQRWEAWPENLPRYQIDTEQPLDIQVALNELVLRTGFGESPATSRSRSKHKPH